MKEPAPPIRHVGLIANTEKAQARSLLREAVKLLRAEGLRVSGDAATIAWGRLDLTPRADARSLAEACDLLMVFGGDGTILRVAREIAGSRTPLIGVHVGRLGFLAEVTVDQLPSAVGKIAGGRFTLETRALLRAENRRLRRPLTALNDFVFTRGEVSRMIELEVAVDGEVLTQFRCDGLVVSSPTGSTAYSLAAGGAIVSPSASVFTITPICPLTLSNRSVIVDLGARIVVRVLTGKLKTHLTADGQVAMQLRPGDETLLTRAPDDARLLRLEGSSFFQTLRQKLHWSGSHA